MPILGKEHPMTPLRMHTGYLAAIAVVGLQLSACASYVAKAPEESAADAALAARIYAALSADPNYYYQHVDVRVDNGIVQLSGYIWSVNALNRAKQIAAAGARRRGTDRLCAADDGLLRAVRLPRI